MQFKSLKELRSLDQLSLAKELVASKNYLKAISFEKSQGNLKDTSQLKKSRTYISWLSTIHNERTTETPDTTQEPASK